MHRQFARFGAGFRAAIRCRRTTVKLSVVIPVYNEKGTFEELLRRIAAVPIPKEVIVVDDASTDGTRDRIRALERSRQASPVARQAAASPAASPSSAAPASPTAPTSEAVTPPIAPMEMVFYYQEVNQGKGAAVRKGISLSTGDVVI